MLSLTIFSGVVSSKGQVRSVVGFLKELIVALTVNVGCEWSCYLCGLLMNHSPVVFPDLVCHWSKLFSGQNILTSVDFNLNIILTHNMYTSSYSLRLLHYVWRERNFPMPIPCWSAQVMPHKLFFFCYPIWIMALLPDTCMPFFLSYYFLNWS